MDSIRLCVYSLPISIIVGTYLNNVTLMFTLNLIYVVNNCKIAYYG